MTQMKTKKKKTKPSDPMKMFMDCFLNKSKIEKLRASLRECRKDLKDYKERYHREVNARYALEQRVSAAEAKAKVMYSNFREVPVKNED